MKTNPLILLLLPLLPTCTAPYSPNMINAPLLERKGDYSLAFNLSSAGPEGQGAYAVSDMFGVTASLSGHPGFGGNRRGFLDVGAGVYQHFFEAVNVECYFGAGIGTSRVFGEFITVSGDTLDNAEQRSNYRRFYVQPAIGFDQEFAEIAFGLRWGHLAYGKYKVEGMDMGKPKGWLLEPFLSVRKELFSNDQFIIRTVLQGGISKPVSGHDLPLVEEIWPFFGVGLTFQHRPINYE